jgi:hypothetical protein
LAVLASRQKPSTAVLLLSDDVGEETIGQYRKLRAELDSSCKVVLLAASGDTVRLPADVERAVVPARRQLEGLYTYRRISAGRLHRDLMPLSFARANPWYSHYWVIEDRVRFSGCWDVLFQAFADSPADLLGTTLCPYEGTTAWDHSLIVPGNTVKPLQWVRGFFPIYRLSERAADALDAAYGRGWTGHYEATMPTILTAAGQRLEDIGGSGPFVAPGNHNRFYENRSSDPSLSPGTLIQAPLRLMAGARPDCLWYPVGVPGMSKCSGRVGLTSLGA